MRVMSDEVGQDGTSSCNHGNRSLEDLLAEAVRKNDMERAALLVEEAQVDVNKINMGYKTPLFLAIENENYPIVEMLVSNGASVNQISFCNKHCSYETPIVTAVRLEQVEMIELFLKYNCCLEFSNIAHHRDGKTALQWAATYGTTDIATMLIKNGADVNWVGPYFQTALHYAAIAEKPAMVELLLKHGAEVTPNGDQRTALHIAAVRGNIEMVDILMSHGHLPVDHIDSFSFTAVSLASLRGHFEVVQIIVDKCNPKYSINFDDCLLRSAEGGHVEIMKYTIDKGADVNVVNKLGESVLSIACRGNFRPVLILLESNANINFVDRRGYSPLQIALMGEQIDIAIALIQHGAAIHALDPLVESPLEIASKTNNPLLVKYIIQAGCRLSKEPWFNLVKAEEKLQELDYASPGPQRFRADSDNQKATWRWIMEKCRSPRPLSHICRVVIREELSAITGGTSIMGLIDALPLPNAVKRYLALEHALQEK